MVEADVLGAEVVLARADDGGREDEGEEAHGVWSMACSVLNVYQLGALSGIIVGPVKKRRIDSNTLRVHRARRARYPGTVKLRAC